MEGFKVVEPPDPPSLGEMVDVEWAGQTWRARVAEVNLPERTMLVTLVERKDG